MAQKQSKIKKLLILGAGGMLATDLLKTFKKSPLRPRSEARKKYEVIGWLRKDLDIADSGMVAEKIGKLKPDIIINAAAYNEVDKAETDFDRAIRINGYALKYLAGAAAKIGATLVHYSTDYVFDGKNPAGYKEEDETNPASSYGQSKFAGEQMILMTAVESLGGCASCGAAHQGCHKMAEKKPLKFYIIRTSWLYGKNGKNFVETMISLGQKLPEIKVVNDQHGKPTYTADLAAKTREIIEKKAPFGIYHVTNEVKGKNGISWYDFAKEIFKIKKIKVKVKPVTTKEFYGSNKNYLAPRPKYSMLINAKLSKTRDWKEALKEYLEEK